MVKSPCLLEAVAEFGLHVLAVVLAGLYLYQFGCPRVLVVVRLSVDSSISGGTVFCFLRRVG